MPQKYDAYISYVEPDANWVENQLLPRFEKAGLAVITEEDFQLGVPRLAEIERAISESRRTLLILSPAYLQSTYQGFESILVSTLGLDTKTWPAIPVLIKTCNLPRRLSALVTLDLRNPDPKDWTRLIQAIDPEKSEPLEEESGPKGVADPGAGEGVVPIALSGLTPEGVAAPTHNPDFYPQAIDELIKARDHRQLTLFIGADLPKDLTGAIPRQQLANELATANGLEPDQPLAAVAQQVMAHGNRFTFTQFLKQKLSNTSPGPFYRSLGIFIQVHTPEWVATTAYHEGLSRTLTQGGLITPQVATNDDSLNFINPDEPAIMKLFGDIMQTDLVVTEQDISALVRGRDPNRQNMIDELQRLFRRTTVLFLGQDMRDPFIKLLFDDVAGGKFQRTAYAVWSGLSEAETTSLDSNRGIKILDIGAIALLDAIR